MSINSDQSINAQIKQIFEENKLEDLKKFIKRRQCLNNCNMYMNYLFHFIQSAGILTATIANGYSVKEFIWLGIGLNILASLIQIYEQTNNTISTKLLNDIQLIKTNNYVDEDVLIDIDEKKEHK